MNEHLPEEEVQEYLNQILYPGVKDVLDNAIMPIEEHAEQGVRPTPDCQGVPQEETIVVQTAFYRFPCSGIFVRLLHTEHGLFFGECL